MERKTIIAIVLIVLGLVAFAYQGITYTTPGKGFDMGPMHVSTEKTHNIPLPPVLGAFALVGGIVLLLSGRRRFGSWG